MKLTNVLMSSQGVAKLIDFGLAKEGVMGNDYAETFCGSPAYLAPELLKEKKFNKTTHCVIVFVSTDKEGKPELGNQPNPTAKIRIRYKPSQKVGMDAKNMASPDVI